VLYVDDTELAAVQAPISLGKPTTIVRQTIADLGPFHPAEAWDDIVGASDAGDDAR